MPPRPTAPASSVHAAFLSVGLLAGTVTLAAGGADRDGRDAADRPAASATRPLDLPRFVEIPGAMEFTGRLLVQPRPVAERVANGLSARAAARLDAVARARLAPHVLEHAAGPDRYVLAIPAGETEQSFADALMATGDYVFAHPDWRCWPAGVPNDPQYGQQWHHQTMESEAGWAVATGRPQIICAFVDTGVDRDHEDLEALLVPGFNSVDDAPEVAGGDVSDVNGHGTLVGGSLGAHGNNALGVAGVGWTLALMPIRTSNNSDGTASLSDILQGAEWAIEHGARSASCSYTGVQAPAVQGSGAYIRSLGGLLVYAANNFAENHAGFDWTDVIVVGATNESDNRAGFSSFGRGVDVFAPGTSIRTTSNGGGYGNASGTSFATPITNGLIGLIWSVDPTLSSEQVEQILFLSCDDKGAPGDDDEWGWGRINVRRAVELAATIDDPQPPVASDDAAETATDYAIEVDVLANDADPNLDALEITMLDAATALGGTAELLAGAGPAGRDLVRYLPPAGVTGTDTFTYEVSDEGGLSASATVVVEVLDASLFRTPDTPAATEPGATVAYYELSNPQVLPDFDALVPYANDVVPAVDFASTGGDFATSGRSDQVGAVFEGFIEVPAASTYLLSVESDDGSKLWVGDELVVDNDGLHGMVEVAGAVALLPGRHAVRVEFFENGGGAGCIVRIDGGGLGRQIVPASRWSHEVEPTTPPCPADANGDLTVGFPDLLVVLSAWGPCPATPCAADVDGSGSVGFDDVLVLLAAWGPCPE